MSLYITFTACYFFLPRPAVDLSGGIISEFAFEASEEGLRCEFKELVLLLLRILLELVRVEVMRSAIFNGLSITIFLIIE